MNRALAVLTGAALLVVVVEASGPAPAAAVPLGCLLDYSGAGVIRPQVDDDGCGLDGAGNGYGPTGVRERVGDLGGTLSLASAAGRGVTLTVELPG